MQAARTSRLYYGWVVVGVVFTAMLLAAGIRSLPGPLVVPLEKEFGWDRATISLAVSINLLLFGLLGPWLGKLMDRRGPKAVMMGGFLLVFMLSGLMFPLSNIPGSLRWLSNLVWSRYYIEIVRDVFLQGGGWPAVWYKVLAIATIGALFFFMAWRRMRRMQLEV